MFRSVLSTSLYIIYIPQSLAICSISLSHGLSPCGKSNCCKSNFSTNPMLSSSPHDANPSRDSNNIQYICVFNITIQFKLHYFLGSFCTIAGLCSNASSGICKVKPGSFFSNTYSVEFPVLSYQTCFNSFIP